VWEKHREGQKVEREGEHNSLYVFFSHMFYRPNVHPVIQPTIAVEVYGWRFMGVDLRHSRLYLTCMMKLYHEYKLRILTKPHCTKFASLIQIALS